MKSRGNVLHECHYEIKFKRALLANGKVVFFGSFANSVVRVLQLLSAKCCLFLQGNINSYSMMNAVLCWQAYSMIDVIIAKNSNSCVYFFVTILMRGFISCCISPIATVCFEN